MQRGKMTFADREVADFSKTLAPSRTVAGKSRLKLPAELLAEAGKKLAHRRAKELAPRYSLYVLWRSWATNALQSGLDALTVAILMVAFTRFMYQLR